MFQWIGNPPLQPLNHWLGQTGFGLHSGDHLPMATSSSTMDQVQCEDNEPMDWQPWSPTDTGLVITPCSTLPTFYYSFHMSMIARLSAAFIILSFPPPNPSIRRLQTSHTLSWFSLWPASSSM